MRFSEYQCQAKETAIYPATHSLIYPSLGLSGEAGEVAEKVKKWIRDGEISPDALHKEVGDVLWYLAAICSDMQTLFGDQYSLENAAIANIDKLRSRKERGKLGGSGDER